MGVQFHAILRKIWQNHMLASRRWAPPSRGNPGSVTAESQIPPGEPPCICGPVNVSFCSLSLSSRNKFCRTSGDTFSRARVGLFTLGSGICVTCSLRFTSVAIPADLVRPAWQPSNFDPRIYTHATGNTCSLEPLRYHGGYMTQTFGKPPAQEAKCCQNNSLIYAANSTT